MATEIDQIVVLEGDQRGFRFDLGLDKFMLNVGPMLVIGHLHEMAPSFGEPFPNAEPFGVPNEAMAERLDLRSALRFHDQKPVRDEIPREQGHAWAILGQMLGQRTPDFVERNRLEDAEIVESLLDRGGIDAGSDAEFFANRPVDLGGQSRRLSGSGLRPRRRETVRSSARERP